MSGDLMAGRYCKHQNQAKKFLEEACALIELGNIVESFRLGHLKLCEPSICNDYIETCKKAGLESVDERAFTAWLKSEAPRRTRPTLSHTRVAKCIRKTTEAKTCEIFNLEKKPKCKLQCLHSEVHKDSKRINREPEKYSRNRQSLPPCSIKDKMVPTKVKEKRINRQLEASNIDLPKCMQYLLKNLSSHVNSGKKSSNIDMAKCMQYLLKDLSSHVHSGKTSIALLPKKDYSKCSLNTRKRSFSDTCLFNKAYMKQNTNKKDKADRISADSKPSLQLKILLNPSSNTMNLQIKSRHGTCGSAKSNPDAIHFRLPFQCDSSVNKLSTNFSSSLFTERSVLTPSAQTSNNREIQFPKPYAKTQAVYHVYDMTPYRGSGTMKGIRSQVSFNFNIGNRSPQTAEKRMYTNDGRPLTSSQSGRLAGNRKVLYKNKVNIDSGATSMQQSFSLGRSVPQSESPYETDCVTAYSGKSSVLDTQLDGEPVLCETCCHANTLQRTRQRIFDRVGADPLAFGRSVILSPIVFLKNCYDKYIKKEEKQTRSVGNCTCIPFKETEQVTVQEENVNPDDCTFLKRWHMC
ncbi:uncharacterized protein LOC134679308 [Cydia fagiglandana]|uniref:uncharacterized protein LOC134679308 n=1 Tax=Cydia fagiglandana TaxID=1458189 RepID=UPI002FEDF0A3